ncbi:amino acid adenylation domain-containing protein [Floridanema evergladense]|uniref:Amino acid adenylation domain-containing protein n=1 Tax=Floridaenema evergladense BLCC-F167 TaxID=3153639 RepID=A0ABV4WRR4_9CYAN
MTNLFKRLENLSPEKRALVLQKLKEQQELSRKNDFQQNSSLRQVSRKQPIPLSFAQQRLWFIDKLEADNCPYNVPIFWQITGDLKISVLEKSIREIVQRHEVLRTTFSVIDGSPIQVIHSSVQLSIQVLDWRDLTETEQLKKAQHLAIEEFQRPFDLSNSPLLRVKLLQLSDNFHLLLIVIHHIIFDGWSMEIFRRELFSLYAAFSDGKLSPLPPLSLQYADFAHWQREWLQGKILQTQLNYWQQQLADVPPLLELPTDRSRPSVQSFRGGSEFLRLDRNLTQKLKHLSQESGTTLFMTLLTAFTILLSRYSRQEDIVLGSAIANRNRKEIEGLIGFFVNSLALRINLQGNPTFLELLARVKRVSLDAYDHQDLPFEKLVDELGLERSLAHHPLFQVAFGLQNETNENLEINGLTVTTFKWENTTTLFDLSLIFRETSQELIGEWEYATDLFDQNTIQRMTQHFTVLLEAIVDRPQQPINSLPLLTKNEIQQLRDWNQTDTNYCLNQTFVDLFEQQVAKNPDRIALVFESQSLTYQQLNQKVNQIAHYLIHNHHIKSETLISICVERSFEMIIGILAILKAGGCYVPIDPKYPQERIQFMLEDSGTSVLLTQSSIKDKLPIKSTCQVIYLESGTFADESTENLLPQTKPENLAYLIYTSGSTGQPKGVMIEHRALVNLILTWAETFQIKPETRWLQFGAFSFDLSIGEIATALSAGATLYLAKSETLLPSQSLVNLLRDRQISHIALPPSTLSILPQASLPDLQNIIVGGEVCPAEIVTQWAKERRFFNCYGPTESTVTVSIAECNPNGKKPDIGKPIANNRIYILDAQNQLLPPGIPGELCIAGIGLSRGYLHRPDLTKEKFIEVDLFGKSERIYKTGDLAKWNFQGNIEYLGRIDDQIKLRGFRVEIGEIEATLLQNKWVKEAVVILYEADDNPRLVAYITTAEKSSNLGNQLKEYLKTLLPNYMVPAQIILLDKLPITPNGKLDRKSLPTPDINAAINWEMPITPTEELLASLWQALLKVKYVSRRDNFFELGGHSLLATQLITRIRDSFGVEISVRKVFEYSILFELAIEIDRAALGVTLPPIAPQPENEPKTLSFAQSRLWFLAQLEGSGTWGNYNISTAYSLNGNLNIEALRASFAYLIKRHEILRTCFPVIEGEAQVIIKNPEQIEVLAIVNLQELPPQIQAETVQNLADIHAAEPFDLNVGPLLKIKLLQLGKQKNVLLINMHHIISDGWSMGVFKREWEQAYSAFASGNLPNFSPLPIQYTDYAAWQRNWLQGEILETQKNYWKQQLKDAPQLLDLPTDYPRPAQQSYQGGREEYSLSGELTEKLKLLSQKQGVSLFMTLLTAFNILLSRYSRQEDLCVGSAIANRTHSHTEGLIGFFVNTLVLRSQIKPEQNFIELLQKTRQTCLEAYSHQDIPFEYLVEQLHPERSLSYNPLFQVMIVLQNMESAGIKVKLPELDIKYLEQDYPFTKFDLTLDVSERDNQLHCMWEYATDLFAPTTIQRMAGHLEILLEAITQNPQQSISTLPLITTVEIKQLQLWNQTNIDYPQDQTLITLFEQQVAKTPDRIALVFENKTLSYEELNQKANQLTYHLLAIKEEKKLPNNSLMAICIERSLEMVIGIFAILKAGGAYVAIDPNYPQERIQLMLEDSNASLLLTTSNIKKKLPLEKLQNNCQVVFWEQEIWTNLATENLIPQSKPNDLAYVIYTSGSTGRPKGVAIAHYSPVVLIKWAHSIFSTEQLAGVLASTSICFDLSIFEIFVPLTQGGSVIVVENALYIEQAQKSIVPITLINTVPSAAAELLNMNVIPPSVKVINLAGEALRNSLVQSLYQATSVTEIYNLYGPSEDTTYSTFTKVAKNAQHEPTIGKAIANTRIYILDKHNQLLPPGIPGELCIAGKGLAQNYLNHPELTAEKFIHLNLFNQTERIYKTGDLARWLPDGNLQYLGRIDRQIKLRGFRIELGEIETLLIEHPTIQEAVVIVREDIEFDRSLVAYIVPTSTKNDDLQNQQVELWQQVFTDAYLNSNSSEDPTLNLAGWNDRYTGEPYPKSAMQEWRDTTVEQILELKPIRVWEIGCGTGMLLFKIAPHCQHYLGTDFSSEALQYIEKHLKQQSLQEKVTLKTCAANQFDGIEIGAYDLVIMNSVIQYFPSLDYFLSVLEGAIAAVKNQGAIFIGDVRNLNLLAAFHTAVEFYRAEDNLSIKELRQRIQQSICNEGELLIDPDFFITIKHKFPRISQVEIQLKRGYTHTEMSRFRYDVVLHLDQINNSFVTPEWLDWESEELNLEKIEQLLTTQKSDLLGIRNIPNARLTSEMILLEKINQLESNVSDLKMAIYHAKLGIEPEAFRTLVRELSYTPFVQYNSTDFSSYDVVFQRNNAEQTRIPRFTQEHNLRSKPWQHYANQPLHYRTAEIDPGLLDEWRSFLSKTLPEYTIPNHFIALEKLPLTPNGKIDRKALPKPGTTLTTKNIELPVTSTEKLLAEIWTKLLKYELIAREDNFFKLGGHSLLGTQLCSRIRDKFKVEIPLRKLFELPTLNELANYIDTCLWMNYSSADIQPLNSDEEEIEL